MENTMNFVRFESIMLQLGDFGTLSSTLFILLLIGILVVTGLALFKAARLNDKLWFWVMFIIGTAGVLPLVYLYLKRGEKPYYLWRNKRK